MDWRPRGLQQRGGTARWLALALIAVVLPALGSGALATATGPAAAPKSASADIRFTQANLLSGMSKARLAQDVDTVLAGAPDFVSYNEVGCRDNSELVSGVYKIWRPHPRTCKKTDPRWYERSNAIVYRGDRWEGLDWGTHTITNDWRPTGAAGVRLAVRFANWVTVREKDTGRTLSVVSAHFAPFKYGKTRASVQRMGVLIDKLSSEGPVLIGGDLNYLYNRKDTHNMPLRAHGMTPTFDDTGTPGIGTRDKGTTIDYVLMHGRDDWEAVGRRAQRINSDHHALTVDLAPKFGPEATPTPTAPAATAKVRPRIIGKVTKPRTWRSGRVKVRVRGDEVTPRGKVQVIYGNGRWRMERFKKLNDNGVAKLWLPKSKRGFRKLVVVYRGDANHKWKWYVRNLWIPR